MEKRQSSLEKYFVRKDCGKKRKTEAEEAEEDDVDDEDDGIGSCEDALENPDWLRIKENNLNVSYANIFSRDSANKIFKKLESEIIYFTGELAQVRVPLNRRED